jgi:outer membrane protein OmpA-like peptidoglycan-associated protein
MRIGYSGFSTRLWADKPSVLGATLDTDENKYLQKFGYMYVHGDFLWNMSNALGGYKETRFWNMIPYLHAGFYRAYGLDDTDFADNELAVGAGMLHNLRLTERLDLIVDMKAIVVNGVVHGAEGVAIQPSVTMGLAVDLGWPAFVRTSTVIGAVELATADQIAALQAATVALELANATLEEDVIALQKTNRNLNNQVNDLKKNQGGMDVSDFLKGMSPVAVYFNIGKTTLSVDEMQHLDYIAKNILAKADKQSKVYITVMGSADSNTGTAKRNQNLSEARGKYVADMLTAKYGIGKDRLVIKSEVVNAKSDPELERAVKISF